MSDVGSCSVLTPHWTAIQVQLEHLHNQHTGGKMGEHATSLVRNTI